VLELVRDADVAVENFLPGTLDALGLGWQTLHEANPALILTSISGFGQEGPYSRYKAPDIVADGMGGIAYLHGYGDREPLTYGNPQASYRAGVMAAGATMAALFAFDGEGEHIDIAAVECVANTLRETIPQYTFMGGIRKRRGSVGGGAGSITPCADGYVIPSGIGSSDWSSFARFMEAPELDDERFSTGDGRQRHGAELARLLRDRLKGWNMTEYFEGAQLWGMGAGVVMNPAQVLACRQMAERAFFREAEVAPGQVLPVPRGPVAL
jgi:crotonobetainyl-CoA:carnitine CoA-transferase CaiB-like acyl-CoA transferase